MQSRLAVVGMGGSGCKSKWRVFSGQVCSRAQGRDLNALGLLWGVLSEGTCESLHQSFIGCEKFSGSAGTFEGKWLPLRASLWKRGCRHLATTMHGSVLVGVGSWELAL